MVTGDFDEDGTLDVAVTHYESSAVSLVLGDGRGAHPPVNCIWATCVPEYVVAKS